MDPRHNRGKVIAKLLVCLDRLPSRRAAKRIAAILPEDTAWGHYKRFPQRHRDLRMQSVFSPDMQSMIFAGGLPQMAPDGP